MVGRAALALAVVAGFLASGCAGPTGTVGPALQFSLLMCDPKASVDAETGALEGFVRDDEFQSIGGVQLQLRELKVPVVSSSDGYFAFCDVPPGRYTLDASKLGFRAAGIGVTIEAGKPAEVSVELVRIPVVGPTHPRLEVLGPFQGYMYCRMSTPLSSGACGFIPVAGNTPVTTLWTNDKIQFRFRLTGEDWEQIVFEARWKPSSAATNPKMTQVFSYTNRTSTHWFGDSGADRSPSKFNFTQGAKRNSGGQIPAGMPEEPNLTHTLITWLTLPFANPRDLEAPSPLQLAYELRFETLVSIFYSSREPEPTYTAFDDV